MDGYSLAPNVADSQLTNRASAPGFMPFNSIFMDETVFHDAPGQESLVGHGLRALPLTRYNTAMRTATPIGHLARDHRPRPVGHVLIDLDAAVDRNGMHES